MHRMRVLLIDDERIVLQSLEYLLQLLGFAIAGTAVDLAGAIELAGSAEADVAILDINLSGQLVYPAADALMARDIPVIFTSGRLTKLPSRFASATFINKPYLPETLIDHIEALASRAMRLASCRAMDDSSRRQLDGPSSG
jgi:DNA-binding response OmpR family regulator